MGGEEDRGVICRWVGGWVGGEEDRGGTDCQLHLSGDRTQKRREKRHN